MDTNKLIYLNSNLFRVFLASGDRNASVLLLLTTDQREKSRGGNVRHKLDFFAIQSLTRKESIELSNNSVLGHALIGLVRKVRI